jgi:predicted transcriptional regulator
MAPKKVPAPTEAELAIMNVLWRRGPSTVREVWNELGQKSGYTTVLKFLQIMFEKRLVKRDAREVSHVYSAAIKEKDTKRGLLRSLAEQAFGGSTRELVLHALREEALPAEELRAIRELIEQAEAAKRTGEGSKR